MSLSAQYDPKNIFAKILSGDIPSARVYEDDRILSFMDAFPQSRGHTLVIPKVQACNLFDIAPHDLQNLIVKTQEIGRAVRDALKPQMTAPQGNRQDHRPQQRNGQHNSRLFTDRGTGDQ